MVNIGHNSVIIGDSTFGTGGARGHSAAPDEDAAAAILLQAAPEVQLAALRLGLGLGLSLRWPWEFLRKQGVQQCL
jgi:hypothetical protein